MSSPNGGKFAQWDVAYYPAMPMMNPDYSMIKDMQLQHHFREIHLSLQHNSERICVQFGLECIEHLRHAAEAYAKAAHHLWNPK